MGVTNYYTVDDQMIGYKDGGGRKDFLTDALGSVTAEIDQTGTNRTFDGRYKPYGGDLWSSGSKEAFVGLERGDIARLVFQLFHITYEQGTIHKLAERGRQSIPYGRAKEPTDMEEDVPFRRSTLVEWHLAVNKAVVRLNVRKQSRYGRRRRNVLASGSLANQMTPFLSIGSSSAKKRRKGLKTKCARKRCFILMSVLNCA